MAKEKKKKIKWRVGWQTTNKLVFAPIPECPPSICAQQVPSKHLLSRTTAIKSLRSHLQTWFGLHSNSFHLPSNPECDLTVGISHQTPSVSAQSKLCSSTQNCVVQLRMFPKFSFIFLFNGLHSLWRRFLTTALKGHRTVWSNYIKMLNAFFIFHISYFMLQSAYVMLHISCSSLPLLRSRWLAASYFIFDNWHLTFFALKFTCQRDIIDTKRHISYPYLYLCFWQYLKIFYL